MLTRFRVYMADGHRYLVVGHNEDEAKAEAVRRAEASIAGLNLPPQEREPALRVRRVELQEFARE